MPDVCQYEGKKTSWDKTAIFVSMETEKKPNQRTKLSQNRPQGLRMMTSDGLVDVSDDRYTTIIEYC